LNALDAMRDADVHSPSGLYDDDQNQIRRDQTNSRAAATSCW